MLRYVCERNDDVLVDEDEQGKKKAEAHGTQGVQARQLVEGRVVEDGPVVDAEHGDCREQTVRHVSHGKEV